MTNTTTTTKTGSKFIAAIGAAALAGALCLGGMATAFADGEQVDAESYSYLAAQQNVSDRMATSEEVAADADSNTDSDGNTYAEGVDRTVDWQVKLLRGKLGAARDHLVTVRGVGYKLEEPA